MRRTILMVDDDLSMQDLVTFILEQSGFAVRAVGDGITALDELRNHAYDLILLDINLPHLNGVSFLRTLRANENFANLPVIMLTASGDRDDVARSKQFEISDYILKPLRKEDLLNRIERVLGGRPQYVQVHFKPEERLAQGHFEVPLRLISIGPNGLVVSSPLEVPRKFMLERLRLTLFDGLKIDQLQFTVTDCMTSKEGFEYFVSFLSMKNSDQEKVREWILKRTAADKNGGLRSLG